MELTLNPEKQLLLGVSALIPNPTHVLTLMAQVYMSVNIKIILNIKLIIHLILYVQI